MSNHPADQKRCGSCQSWLPASQFGADASHPDALSRACNDCRARCYRRNRTAARLRDAKNHQARRAAYYRARFEALLATLSPGLLATLPADIRPKTVSFGFTVAIIASALQVPCDRTTEPSWQTVRHR